MMLMPISMGSAKGRYIAMIAALAWAEAAFGDAPILDWNELVDQNAQVFDDP